MYDPFGHFAISTLIIGAIIGAVVGFGIAAYIDYQDDDEIFNGSVKWYDYLGATVLGGVLGAGIGAGAGYILPYISTFANTSFTFGSGLSLASNGTVAIVNGLTVTGEQILKGLGILAAIIGKSGGYTVKKYLNDHDPSHVHIYGDDIADKAHGIRIGADGKPLPGQGKLPHGAKKAIKKLWKIISQLL